MKRVSPLSLIILLLTLSLVGCGYKIASSKPSSMSGISSLNVIVPDNRTQYPRLEAQLGNNLVDAFLQDGVYRITSSDDSDATLVTKITSVQYRQVRTSRTDGLLPEELSMKVNVSWKVVSNTEEGIKTLANGSETGTTRFFLEDNLQIARLNAFPDALQRVSRQIVSSLSNSF